MKHFDMILVLHRAYVKIKNGYYNTQGWSETKTRHEISFRSFLFANESFMLCFIKLIYLHDSYLWSNNNNVSQRQTIIVRKTQCFIFYVWWMQNLIQPDRFVCFKTKKRNRQWLCQYNRIEKVRKKIRIIQNFLSFFFFYYIWRSRYIVV